MKTIEVTDEMYEFLTDLSNELNTQNHRGTQMPYFFQIQTTEEKPTSDGMGEKVWVMEGEICLRSEKDIRDAIYEFKEWEDINSGEADILYSHLMEHEKDNILKGAGYQPFDVINETKLQNSFLTGKACEEHIKLNHYHYNNPVSYLSYATRNYELEKVMQFLCEITGGKIHK